MAIEHAKEIARKIQELISEYDEKASYQSCLNAVSRYYGYENWNTLSAILREKENDHRKN